MDSAHRYQRLYRHKIRAYRWLYEFTQRQCMACATTGCACKDSICAHVEEQLKKRGEAQAPPRTGHSLRFIGCNGCVVPPHQRETCTIYLCESAKESSTFDRHRYEKLVRLCSKIDWRLMELEEAAAASRAVCP